MQYVVDAFHDPATSEMLVCAGLLKDLRHCVTDMNQHPIYHLYVPTGSGKWLKVKTALPTSSRLSHIAINDLPFGTTVSLEGIQPRSSPPLETLDPVRFSLILKGIFAVRIY